MLVGQGEIVPDRILGAQGAVGSDHPLAVLVLGVDLPKHNAVLAILVGQPLALENGLLLFGVDALKARTAPGDGLDEILVLVESLVALVLVYRLHHDVAKVVGLV